MSGGIRIRFAAPSDARNIAETERLYIDCPWTLQQIESEISSDGAVFLTAEFDGEFCGYVSGAIAADECEMSNIAVSEKYRRRGVGRALMREFIKILRERSVRSVFLLVRDDNTAAVELYSKFGFEIVGTRHGYYKGKDAKIMRTTL